MFSEKVSAVLNQATKEQWPYPKAFDALKAAGVTHYEALPATHQITYFGEKKQAWIGPIPPDFKRVPGATTFDADGVRQALKRSQQRLITYPQFLHEISAAGCSHYRVDMASRTVTYMGEKGEQVIEPIPPTKTN